VAWNLIILTDLLTRLFDDGRRKIGTFICVVHVFRGANMVADWLKDVIRLLVSRRILV